MGKFNLLDEPWVSVVYDDRGATKEVSLLDLFQNAHNYKDLAGDTKTQDFAILRVLLAVLHTVFSRFDADGQVYDFLEVDDRFRQLETVDEDDLNDYEDALYETWVNLWNQGQFPEIVSQYLEKWRDRFYLLDEEYPFFQVRKEDISEEKINKLKAGSVSGKFINRTISESGNKESLFAPRSSQQKELLNFGEVARWLLAFQGYTGTGDKTKFNNLDSEVKLSKGWLFDIGAVIVKGQNLFETLLLNCILPYRQGANLEHIQVPCWELSSGETIKNYLAGNVADNLSSLYTNWSRAICIDSEINLDSVFSMQIVKLPEVPHQDNFLEPFTLWKYNLSGESKGNTPNKHSANQSLWRSFASLTITVDNQRKPGIIDWLDNLKEQIGEQQIELSAVSMKDDGNATSWLPTDEIIDTLFVNEFVLTDLQEKGWVTRINDVVEETKTVVSNTYRRFIKEIKEIRNIQSDAFTSQKVEECYFKIDQPFRQWLASIHYEDEKDCKVFEWRQKLKNIVLREAQTLLQEGGPRDYLGIIDKDKGTVKNIATAYDNFTYWLNQNMKEGK